MPKFARYLESGVTDHIDLPQPDHQNGETDINLLKHTKQ